VREGLLTLGVVALLAAAAFLLGFAPWEPLVRAGVWLAATGMVAGVPAALVYHLRLRACLAPRGALDRRWLLNPVAHHERLTRAERRRVMPWFYAGAAGWTLSMGGCALMAIALVRIG